MPLLYLNLNQCQADKRVGECLIDLWLKGNYTRYISDTLFPQSVTCKIAGTKLGGPEET